MIRHCNGAYDMALKIFSLSDEASAACFPRLLHDDNNHDARNGHYSIYCRQTPITAAIAATIIGISILCFLMIVLFRMPPF